jgi:hypothetical protein
MDRSDVCILINSTPKYYYLLPLQLTLLRRYAPDLHWPIYLASEEPTHPTILECIKEHGVHLLRLDTKDSGFLESRWAALKQLAPTIQFVLPLQEDFLLDRTPDYEALKDALFILDTDRFVSSLRLTPCPGPHESDLVYTKEKPWKILGSKNTYIFTYQATLWRRLDLQFFYQALFHNMEKDFAKQKTPEQRKILAVQVNIGENRYGQEILKKTLPDTHHLAWPRSGSWSNAVYLCPWPYRPTAVTRGNLEPFAEELFSREGVKLNKPSDNTLYGQKPL